MATTITIHRAAELIWGRTYSTDHGNPETHFEAGTFLPDDPVRFPPDLLDRLVASGQVVRYTITLEDKDL
ncbi:hypothetical protein ACPCG0_09685 [Propionibacteriaceae bacterium Y1923]